MSASQATAEPIKILREPPWIQYEVYSTSDWLRMFPENIWQIWTMNTGVLMGSVTSVGISSSLHVMWSVPKMECDQQRLDHISSFYPLCFKLWLPGTMPASLRYPRLIPGNIGCFLYSCVVAEHLLVHPMNYPLDPPLKPQERCTAYNLSHPTHNLYHITGTMEHYCASPGAQDSWQNRHQHKVIGRTPTCQALIR